MIAKWLNYVFNQNANVTKQRERFAKFAISIVDNVYLLQQYKWIKIKMWFPWLIINALYESHFMTILGF